ncbi:MAG: M12 family metallopeptidase [Labilithrix sp.]|nr:M12 family metallopeptidase [Labilithrix sp.]
MGGCVVGSGTAQRPPPYGGPSYGPATAGGPLAGGSPAETYRPLQPRQHATALLFLPGSQNQQLVRYAVVDGQAIMEGDIMLGPAAQVPLKYGMPFAPQRNVRSAVALASRTHFWPRSEIPFVIDGSINAKVGRDINGAIAHVNTTSLKLRPRTPADNDFVVFRDNGDGCSSFLGRIGGRQDIQVTDGCQQGGVVHEILHAAGFFHEQSRGDRDEFITIAFNEISRGFEDNFEKRDSRGVDIGPYDFGSIMHYSARAFSRSGRPTIIPKVAGVTIGQREGLSQLDRAAIEELYAQTTPPPSVPGPTTVPPPTTPPPTTPPPAASGSFAGNYSSNRGNVACAQSGNTVNCQYPGGFLVCAANGQQLDCGWSGGGQGRASFARQANGVIAGTFGDLFSHDSRGAWTLTPLGQAPPSTPPPAAPPPGAGGNTSLSGNYATTRGPMACTDSGSTLSCSFQETPTVQSRLECNKDAQGLALACNWLTFLPPGSGRARFTRPSTAERTFTGTWGHFTADSGGGTWELRGQ